MRSAEVYELAGNQWTSIAPMLHKRSDFASIVFRREVYAIGGFAGEHYQASVERYNTAGNSWSHVINLQMDDLQDADGEVCGQVELLDIISHVWSVASSLSVPRSALKAVIVENLFG